MAGLTPQGLEIKTFDEVLDSLNTQVKANLGVELNTDDDSVMTNIYSPAADEISDLWQALQSVYNSRDPNTATDESLDRAATGAGIVRLAATQSFITAQYFIGLNNTIIPAGSIIEVDGTLERFENTSSVTISAGNCISITSEISTVSDNTSYDVSINGTNFSILSDGDATALEISTALADEINLSILTVTASVVDTDKLNILSDDQLTPMEVVFGPGISILTATVTGFVEAQNFGPIPAPASTLVNIITPVVGWTNSINVLDAIVGRNTETDPELRVRYNESLAITGTSTVPAIRAKLAQVDNVQAAIVIENDLEVPDADGRPPHSFESIVLGGDDNAIGEVILENKPAGIQTYGSEEVTVVDIEGVPKIVKFSRPDEIYLHVRVSYTIYSEESFPATTGEATMSAIVLETGNGLTIGNDVIPGRFIGPLYAGVSGLETIIVEIATSATPIGAPGAYQTITLPIADTEIAIFDSSRIIIQEV